MQLQLSQAYQTLLHAASGQFFLNEDFKANPVCDKLLYELK
ncbi:hypothetical protein PsAD14_05745 [Pseudovibrio sp. Ad14]|nr:hypothetical protein PsW74_03857 [Pseudovibrio sp. W74]KZL03215.1 hypothetical protein PsAD14_05745 [Pseudovibrio sp. Ad14]